MNNDLMLASIAKELKRIADALEESNNMIGELSGKKTR